MLDRFYLGREEAALVIVDIQDRLASVMEDRREVTANCLHLIEAARLLHMPVLVTEQYPKGLGPTVREIREALPSYRPIEKLTFDCCREAPFMDAVYSLGRKKMILTGMETHICVLQTCLGLLKDGYQVHVARDAVCSRTKENFLSGIGMMRDAGAVITCTETALFQLLERAGTEEFKAISKRIK
jgi:nicotinamidase-related amidase